MILKKIIKKKFSQIKIFYSLNLINAFKSTKLKTNNIKIQNKLNFNYNFIDIKKKSFLYILNYRFFSKKLFLKKKIFSATFFKSLKKKNNYLLSFLKINFNCVNILLKSKLIFNYSDVLFFLENKFIYLNKRSLLKYKYNFLFVNFFFLELVFLKNYFFFVFKINFFSINFKNFKMLKKKRINRNENYFLKKIKNDVFLKNNLKNNLEVDFLTLSIFLIKIKINFLNYSLKIKKFLQLFNINYLK